MPCYYPLQAYRTDSGAIAFAERGAVSATLQLPCGRCIGCRLERSRQWAVRCTHEAQMHDHNHFVTLTYERLPPRGSLDYRDFQLFMKRLRKSRGKVRFFACGEYGSRLDRPHFHALLFGLDLPDLRLWSDAGKHPLYTSVALDSLWSHGKCFIGAVTFESAAYVARYVIDKITGDMADEHYRRVDPATGEEYHLTPEMCAMSRRPGIGATWYEKYTRDVHPAGELVARGVQQKAPRFYDALYRRDGGDDGYMQLVRADRAAQIRALNGPETTETLRVSEEVAAARQRFYSKRS